MKSWFRSLRAQLSPRRNIAFLAAISLVLSAIVVMIVNNDFSSDTSFSAGEVSVAVDDEIDQLVGNADATFVLGGTIVPYQRRAETLEGTPDTTGLVALTANDIPIATGLAPKSSFFKLENIPLSFRSTAVSQILLTPGILTGEPVIDTLLLAITESLNETNRVEENLRRDARQFGPNYLSTLSDGTKTLINEAARALLQQLPESLSDVVPPQITTTTQSVDTNAYEYDQRHSLRFQPTVALNKPTLTLNPSDDRPALPPSCDVGVKNYTDLEHDNLCITRVTGGGTETPTTTRFVIENRSPRWVLVYLDKPEVSIEEVLASARTISASETIVPDAAIAPKEWIFPNVLNLAIRFAAALKDSNAANKAKEILNYMPWVKLRESNDSLAEQIELKFREFSQDFRTEIELETSIRTRMTTISAGLPRSTGFSGHISGSARDELRRLIATTGTIVSTLMVPIIRVVLDIARPTPSNKACTFEDNARGAKTFVALSEFTLNNAEDIAPFAEALVGATPDSFIDGVINTAPNAIRAILTGEEPWSMIGYYLFSNCDKGMSADQIGRMNAMMLSLGYEPERAEDIITEYAQEEITILVKSKIRDAIMKRLIAMSTGWGTLVQAIEAAPNLANLFFGVKELIEDSWKYDTEDSYFFVDDQGYTLVLPPWPQQVWSVNYLDDSDIELRIRDDGTLTLSSGKQLVVIDPDSGSLLRKYEVIGSFLTAFDGRGTQLWRSDFDGLANLQIRDLTPIGHPILESSFIFFGSTLEVFDKNNGAKIGELSGSYAIGESIWKLDGASVSIFNADTVTLETVVQMPFRPTGLTRQLYSPGSTTLVLGANGESSEIDRTGSRTPVSLSGLVNDATQPINSGTNGCYGPVFRRDGKLTAIDAFGATRWIFRSEDLDDVTAWHVGDECNIYVGNDDGRIWFIDRDAKSLWNEDGQTLRNRLSPISAITVSGNTLLVGSGNERELFALDSNTGQDLWRLPLDAGVTSILTWSNFVVFALSNGQVKRLNTTPTK